jgi:carboxyl-terminal processing protease
MGNGKSYGVFCFICCIALLFAGCSSSDGDGESTVPLGYQTYKTNESDLVLKIPIMLDVSQEYIEEIYYYADLVSYCYTTNRDTIGIALAEACVYYDMLYLYPEYFPQNLDNILDVADLVGYLDDYDRFTYYFSPSYFSEIISLLIGDSAFIGFSVTCGGETVSDDTPLYIYSIDPYTRAWIDGFEVGDRILAIDGTDINGMDVDAAVLLFPEEEEEPVEITIDRDGVEIMISTAAEENIGLLLDDTTAYLSVRSFTAITAEEVRMDFEALQTAAGGLIDKLILDFRDDGGGVQSGMLMLADYLIDMDDGTYPIMSTSGPAFDDVTEYLGDQYAHNIGSFDSSNFVLLVNDYSASASEVVAAALKYYDTAYLIGETTYGKGIGQTVIELVDGSGVFIPSKELLPASGVSYHGIGIEPDDYVYDYPISFDDDPVLDAAVEYLNGGSVSATAVSPTRTAIDQRASDSEQLVDPFQRELIKKSRNGKNF